jgi:hypothetical protein
MWITRFVTYLSISFHIYLTYYYSFLAHYNKKSFDINWFHLLSPAILSLWYSRFEVTWLLRDDSNSKTSVRLPEVLHGDFLSEIKYLLNLEGNILHILTRNVIFFYDYSTWGELSFNIFKFFMYTNRTRVLLLVSSLKSHVLRDVLNSFLITVWCPFHIKSAFS